MITIPNVLTFLRLLFAAPLFWAITADKPIIAIIFIILAALTDFFDGYLARKLRQQSRLGKIADPFVDKFFGGSSLLALALAGFVPWFVFGLFLARDLFLVLVSVILLLQHKELVAETKIGKVSTGVFMLSLVLVVANIPIPYGIHLFYVCFALYVFSGLLYSVRIFQSPEASSVKQKAKDFLTEIKLKVSSVKDPEKGENAKDKTGDN